MNIRFQIATPADFPQMATFIAQHNKTPENHCLHCAQTSEEILAELKDYNGRNEERFILAFEKTEEEAEKEVEEQDKKNKNIVGLIGGDCDDPITEIWLWGPFIAKNAPQNFKRILLEELQKTFPTIRKMTAFYNLKNTFASTFYNKVGFKEKTTATHEYHCALEDCPENLTVSKQIVPYTADYKDHLDKLHKVAFPKAYYTTQEMIDLQSEDYKLWLILEELDESKPVEGIAKMLGYIFINITPNKDGYIHFVAVSPSHRRKGIASKMLHKALHFFFIEKKLISVYLTVSDQNNARRLYHKNGFFLRYSGRGAFWNAEDENGK